MELRFVAANADVQVGDELITSGLDGVYPPGLAVARVATVQRQAETSFARIELAPVASADGRRHVLVLPLKPRKVDDAAAAAAAPGAAASSTQAASLPGSRRP
jgi:rod shape-determining protein MreC